VLVCNHGWVHTSSGFLAQFHHSGRSRLRCTDCCLDSSKEAKRGEDGFGDVSAGSQYATNPRWLSTM